MSDEEAEFTDEPVLLYHIQYGSGIVIATTRPETMLADMAVAVHPSDARYAHLIAAGAKVREAAQRSGRWDSIACCPGDNVGPIHIINDAVATAAVTIAFQAGIALAAERRPDVGSTTDPGKPLRRGGVVRDEQQVVRHRSQRWMRR